MANDMSQCDDRDDQCLKEIGGGSLAVRNVQFRVAGWFRRAADLTRSRQGVSR